MRILSAASIQLEPVIDYAGVKNKATSSGSGSKTRSVTDPQSSSPVHDGKTSVDKAQKIDAEGLKKELAEANEQMKLMNRSIQFSVDESSKDIVVKIIDKTSGEVISQIPPEEVLKLRERLQEMTGLIIEKTV